MVLLRKGSRLSVQPVTEAEWTVVLKLAGSKVSKKNKQQPAEKLVGT
jgi:predicted RNA-binding protein with PUA-like domain